MKQNSEASVEIFTTKSSSEVFARCCKCLALYLRVENNSEIWPQGMASSDIAKEMGGRWCHKRLRGRHSQSPDSSECKGTTV